MADSLGLNLLTSTTRGVQEPPFWLRFFGPLGQDKELLELLCVLCICCDEW